MNSNQTLIESFRAAADFLEAHPDLGYCGCGPHSMMLFVKDKDELVSVTRSIGGTWKKVQISEGLFSMSRRIADDVTFYVHVQRDLVCIPKTIVKRLPAEPEMVIAAKPERTVEITEWECPDSILRPMTHGERVDDEDVQECQGKEATVQP